MGCGLAPTISTSGSPGVTVPSGVRQRLLDDAVDRRSRARGMCVRFRSRSSPISTLRVDRPTPVPRTAFGHNAPDLAPSAPSSSIAAGRRSATIARRLSMSTRAARPPGRSCRRRDGDSGYRCSGAPASMRRRAARSGASRRAARAPSDRALPPAAARCCRRRSSAAACAVATAVAALAANASSSRWCSAVNACRRRADRLPPARRRPCLERAGARPGPSLTLEGRTARDRAAQSAWVLSLSASRCGLPVSKRRAGDSCPWTLSRRPTRSGGGRRRRRR